MNIVYSEQVLETQQREVIVGVQALLLKPRSIFAITFTSPPWGQCPLCSVTTECIEEMYLNVSS